MSMASTSGKKTKKTFLNSILKNNVQMKKGDTEIKHLVQTVKMKEEGALVLARYSGRIICLVALIMVFWAAMLEIDEIYVTSGEVVSKGELQTVQHVKGGTISDILVKEGQHVASGDVLIKFNPEDAVSQLKRLEDRKALLSLKAERFRAVSIDEEPDFSMVDSKYAHMVVDQSKMYATQMKVYKSEKNILETKVEQYKAEMKSLGKQKETLNQQLKLVGEEVAVRDKMAEKGLVSKAVYLETKRESLKLSGEIERISDREHMLGKLFADTSNRLEEVDIKFHQEALYELDKINSELADIEDTIRKTDESLWRLDIRSPANGIVKEIKYKKAGNIVPPQTEVISILPMGDKLQVEAKIQPDVADFITVGQKAEIRPEMYGMTRNSSMIGYINEIIPSVFMGTDNKPYHKVVIHLNKDNKLNGKPVLPGMKVKVNIIKGTTSLLHYILKPVYLPLRKKR